MGVSGFLPEKTGLWEEGVPSVREECSCCRRRSSVRSLECVEVLLRRISSPVELSVYPLSRLESRANFS